MHKEILTKNQQELLPKLKVFSQDLGLVGGTAIALQIGHRKSVDFDLFSEKEFDNAKIRNSIVKIGKIDRVIRDEKDQYEPVLNGVRVTFLRYPFKISFTEKLGDVLKMPDLLTLSAMKAYTLGRRAKWKDYVDLYFVIRNYHGLAEIVKRAKKIFGKEFNEKNLRVQLAYFKDIDFSEKIIFMPGYEVSDKEIQKALIKWSVE